MGVDYIDPELASGDNALIIGIAFKWGQLANTGDYSMVQPYGAITRCSIDFLLCLGDMQNEGKIWQHDRFLNCQQVRLPAQTYSSTDGAARKTSYEWRVKAYTGRFGGSYYKESDTIVVP